MLQLFGCFYLVFIRSIAFGFEGLKCCFDTAAQMVEIYFHRAHHAHIEKWSPKDLEPTKSSGPVDVTPKGWKN